ncbi:DUF6382 domain-containing protein [Paenibacillus oryzisoli]|uniref:FHA domain-containing protein n=1 Tax=Paenibacillus oryzisoli TaxID=1850517 RepID=A0A198A424_9BACL|nr:DUF6382 domain-containing protein [Paenibacillus oryzisoli]OAS16244.1 hypothetical protein A8708_19680 [Paenibacillus oryzisoli]
MTQEVFGLRYEFVYRHGHLMELYKEGGLATSELSNLQVRMLEANQVPRLLPLDIHEVDSNIRLLYRLSSKRMLSHVMKVENFSIQFLAKLIYAIVCTLDESKNYMLCEMNFVLKDNFIFIGQDWSDVYLTYAPIHIEHDVDECYSALDALLHKLIVYLGEEEQDQLLKWMPIHLNRKSFQSYKEAFIKLMDESILTQVARHTVQSQPVEATLIEQTEQGLPKAHWKQDEAIPILPKSENPKLAKHDPTQLNGQENNPSSTANVSLFPFSFVPLQQRGRWMAIALLFILLAFLWQYYWEHPKASTLQIMAGLTLLLGDAGFVLLFLGRPEFINQSNQTRQKSSINPNTTNPAHEVTTDNVASAPSPQDMQHYYQKLSMQTTLLSPSLSNATVLLGKIPKQDPLGPRLESQGEGDSRTVPINSDVFTIGRGDSSSKVDYVVDDIGVSRIHAEIVQTSNGFQLRDAGSTNGTFLNDFPLVTYQGYSLKDGDIVRIIRQELIFRL